jgi:iron complex outermembrane receptor protein
MRMKQNRFIYLLAFLLSLPPLNAPAAEIPDENQDTIKLDEIVVTAPPTTNPLTVKTNPKAPRQPVPPNDGSGYLKNIPGFTATRKGGTGGDPAFRGLGASRLNILLDGTYLQGGCGGRMDPPTTYIFPESYDKITILKGPETVLYGGGNIAGTVLFERFTPRFTTPGTRINSSLLIGNNGRNDELLDVTSGDSSGFVRIIRTRSHSDDYEDGNDNKIHSFYTRNSLTVILGLTPDENTRYEFAADTSKAQAAYADRGMDGSKFDRNDYSFVFNKKNISPLLTNLNFKIYHNYIDHVMDNYSLRPRDKNMAMATNPDRTITGARLAADLKLNSATTSTIGLDYQENKHTFKGTVQSTTFKNLGIFGDIHHKLSDQSRFIGGLRADFLDVDKTLASAAYSDKNTTYGAFLRYEHDLKSLPATTYLGIGHAERPADWWERNRLFSLKPEKNTQLDTGITYHNGKLQSNLSLFYSKINDFILIHWTKTPAAENIDATLYGSEADATYTLSKIWSVTATLAYTHGYDNTYDRTLPQIPPFEATLGLNYAKDKLGAGLLWRGVKTKTSFDKGNGSIISQDLGPSAGFGILSANLTYRPNKKVLISAGVDNLFNKNYAEFVSKNGAAISALGIPATYRINEPGRTVWLKTSYNF